uniref:IRF tryptophan pentad repeat domain-containing protein n=1 Tax=Anas platyrhynchos platyrhynchos TaxID=8840 RepID=A0A493U0U8_ANAPP
MCDRNGGRRLRQWLIEQIDSELYPGLIWESEEKSMFRIPWKHLCAYLCALIGNILSSPVVK